MFGVNTNDILLLTPHINVETWRQEMVPFEKMHVPATKPD